MRHAAIMTHYGEVTETEQRVLIDLGVRLAVVTRSFERSVRHTSQQNGGRAPTWLTSVDQYKMFNIHLLRAYVWKETGFEEQHNHNRPTPLTSVPPHSRVHEGKRFTQEISLIAETDLKTSIKNGS